MLLLTQQSVPCKKAKTRQPARYLLQHVLVNNLFVCQPISFSSNKATSIWLELGQKRLRPNGE